jgi:hypothetical protein
MKQVSCEKSDCEVFQTKKLLNKANEDLRKEKSDCECSVRQYLDSQAIITLTTNYVHSPEAFAKLYDALENNFRSKSGARFFKDGT